MPDYTRGETREILTAVKVTNSASGIYYAWKAKDIASEVNVSTQDLAALGHELTANLPDTAIYFLRASSPKPGRASKIINRNPNSQQKGSVSTFYASDALKTAIAAGWNPIKRPNGVSLHNTTRYVNAVAKLSNGVLYAYPLNKRDFEEYKATLGLQAPNEVRTQADRSKLVMGSSLPRPAKVSKTLDGGKQFSTFVSTDSIEGALTAGFNLIQQELIA